MDPLYINLIIDANTGKVKRETNIEEDKIGKFLVEVLRSDRDDRLDCPTEEKPDVYKISIAQNADGSHILSSNAGSKDMETGLLIFALTEMIGDVI